MLKKLIVPIGIGLGMGAAYTPWGERLSDVVTKLAVKYHLLPASRAPVPTAVVTTPAGHREPLVETIKIGDGSKRERDYVEWIRGLRTDQPTVVIYKDIAAREAPGGREASPVVIRVPDHTSGPGPAVSVAAVDPTEGPPMVVASVADKPAATVTDTPAKAIVPQPDCLICSLDNPLGRAGGPCSTL